MISTETEIETQDAGAYLTALGQILSERAESATGGSARVEISEDTASIDLEWGRCVMHAKPASLELRFEAESPRDLESIQELIARHLEHLGGSAPELARQIRGEADANDSAKPRDRMRHFHRRAHKAPNRAD